MQNIILIFIVIFSLAIGFFLGLFLLSLDIPLTRKFSKRGSQQSEEVEGVAETGGSSSSRENLPQIRKPSPGSKLVLQVWKEEGKPPVYEFNGTYLEKEKLPRELLNLISIQEAPPPKLEPAQPLQVEEKQPADESPLSVEDDEPEMKILSVIEEVNSILQKKLIGSPLAGKGIHMMENHNKEIRFWVGLNSYDDVDEIPDADVRQIIDESVKEWEKSRE